MRLIWIAAILASVSYGFYNIAKSVNEYERFDVITNARVVIPEVLIFPAITICTSGVY